MGILVAGCCESDWLTALSSCSSWMNATKKVPFFLRMSRCICLAESRPDLIACAAAEVRSDCCCADLLKDCLRITA